MTASRSPDYDDKTDEAPHPPRAGSAPTPALEPNEARGGVTNHNVRNVLRVSLVLLIIAFAVVYLIFFH